MVFSLESATPNTNFNPCVSDEKLVIRHQVEFIIALKELLTSLFLIVAACNIFRKH